MKALKLAIYGLALGMFFLFTCLPGSLLLAIDDVVDSIKKIFRRINTPTELVENPERYFTTGNKADTEFTAIFAYISYYIGLFTIPGLLIWWLFF